MTIGLNISGGEFGGTGGVHDQQYHYPTLSELQFYKDKGVDLVRLPFAWERMQDSLGGPLDTNGDLAMLKRVLVDAASLGLDVIIDNHNYGRFNGVALGAAGGPTPAQFADFWKKMAIELKDYSALAGYDLMNEPHDMPTSTIWKESAQAAVNAIRTVDTANTIIIEGDNWSGAHSWANSNNAKLIINDPANNIVYQAHQYLDRDSSGTYSGSYDQEGAYANVGVDKLKGFVDWLNANGLKGMIGEFGVPSNDVRWLDAQKNMLDYMNANNLDGTAWGGGAWWPTDYSMYTAAPGRADSEFGNLLEGYYGQFGGFGTGTVAPPPVRSSPSVAIDDLTVNESAGFATFIVTRSGDLSTASSVNYSTADGTALAGSDYTALSGTVSFAAGETAKTVSIAITNDVVVEGNETVRLNLTGGTNVTISDAQGIGTIVSDDVVAPPPPAPEPVAGVTIMGKKNADNLIGTGGNDHIYGLNGNDVINGGGGADILSGGKGNDRFVFDSAVNANGDRVTDFNVGDKLDFRAMDANGNVAGDQAFTWLDTGQFTGSAGQLREYDFNGAHYVAGDVNGDGIADFALQVSGTNNLSSGDFLF